MLTEMYKFWRSVRKVSGSSCLKSGHKQAKKIAYYIKSNEEHEEYNIYTTCGTKKCVNPEHLKVLKRNEIAITENINLHDQGLFAAFNTLTQHDNTRETIIRAPFGYPGGKTQSLNEILPELPHRNTYVEPFGGSGIVLLSRNESPLEVYNDRFGGVVSFYRVLRDAQKIDALINRLELTLHSREEFIWCRDTWKNVEDDIERAARWWYMVVTSFTQQGRNFGRATSSYAQHGKTLKNNLELFYPCHNRLRNVQIENLDWRLCLQDYDNEDTVFYLDPPYVDFSKVTYENNFTIEDHIELCERIFQLNGFVALSGYGDEKTLSLYGKYPWSRIKTWQAYSSMNAAASDNNNNRLEKSNREKTNEMLFIKEATI